MKSTKTVDDMVEKLERRHMDVKPAAGPIRDNAALVLDAVRAGEPLVAKKFFQAGGHAYQPGDVFPAEGEKVSETGVSKLAATGYVITKALADKGAEASELVDILNKLMPLRITLHQTRQEAERAAAAVGACRAQLAHLEGDARMKAERIAYVENEMAEFLKGEDVSKYLAE